MRRCETNSFASVGRWDNRRGKLARAVTIVLGLAAAAMLPGCEQVESLGLLTRSAAPPLAAEIDASGDPSAWLPTEEVLSTDLTAAQQAATLELLDRPSVLPSDGETPKIQVGLLVPLSGIEARLGRSMMRAAQLALYDLADDAFVLRPYDTRGSPEGARAAANKAVGDGISLFLGPLFAGSVAMVTPVARDAGINIIAFSNDPAVAGPHTFLIGHMLGDQVARVVNYAARRGIRRVAALVPEGPFGRLAANALRSTTDAIDAEITRIVTYDSGVRSIDRAVRRLARYDVRHAALLKRRATLLDQGSEAALAEIDRLKDLDTLGGADFEALLLPTASASLKSIAARLPYYDLATREVRLLGLVGWDGLDLAREPAFKGAWFTQTRSAMRSKFETRYRALFGYRPGPLAALAYDAAAVAAVLGRVSNGSNFRIDAILQPRGFRGVSGLFRFRDDGLNERRYAVAEFTGDRVRVVSAAAESFMAPRGEEEIVSEALTIW